MVWKLEHVYFHLRRPPEKIPDPVGFEIAGQEESEASILVRPANLDDLRAVVVSRVTIVGVRMQPVPPRPEEVRGATELADLDRDSAGPRRTDQSGRPAGRVVLGGFDQGSIQDQPIGRKAGEDRGHRSEVIQVRVAHDHRLEAAHAGRPQRRHDGPDPQRAVVEASCIEDHPERSPSQQVARPVADIQHRPLRPLEPVARKGRRRQRRPSGDQPAQGESAQRPERGPAPDDREGACDRRPAPTDPSDIEIRHLPAGGKLGDREHGAGQHDPRMRQRNRQALVDGGRPRHGQAVPDGQPADRNCRDGQWQAEPRDLSEMHDRDGRDHEPDRDTGDQEPTDRGH